MFIDEGIISIHVHHRHTGLCKNDWSKASQYPIPINTKLLQYDGDPLENATEYRLIFQQVE